MAKPEDTYGFKKEDKDLNKAMTVKMVIIKIKALVGAMIIMTKLV